MVVKVRLKGLNVRQSRGKWYVSIRETGASLVKGFEGTRADLDKHLSSDRVLADYLNARPVTASEAFEKGTFGHLIKWFKEECPRWDKLSEASKKDYGKSFDYLGTISHEAVGRLLDFPVSKISQPGIYQMRNVAAKKKWGRFADKLVSHLSTVFKEAVKVGLINHNPAVGVEKLHFADPNANHEWSEEEVKIAVELAPDHLLIPIVLARYQGFRGQTCASLMWSNYVNDARTIKAFSVVLRKNEEPGWFPCAKETRIALDGIKRHSTHICLSSDNVPWKSEKVLQGAVSRFLQGLKEKKLIRPGCTLHGLRVTYAAALRRKGHDAGIVADALGDRSRRMGEHYTRHVEKELGRMKAFGVVQTD